MKSQKITSHLYDLEDIFKQLENMRLNLAKCVFGVRERKFLEYLITKKGIEANLDHIREIDEMLSPKNKKEALKLTGRLAAQNKSISKYSNKCSHLKLLAL